MTRNQDRHREIQRLSDEARIQGNTLESTPITVKSRSKLDVKSSITGNRLNKYRLSKSISNASIV